MKKIITLIFTLLLLGSFTVFSQGTNKKNAVKQNPVEVMKKQLNLSDDQVARLNTIYTDFDNNIKQLRIDLQREKLNLSEELIKENPDMVKIKSIIDKKSGIESQIELINIKRDIDIRNVLTKEQIEKWKVKINMNKNKMNNQNNRPKK